MENEPALTPQLLLRAYAAGVFPMAQSRDDPEIFWVDPQFRGIIPLDGFHVSRSLARRARRGDLRATWNADFGAVLAGCADREETWINADIAELYGALHRMGHVHSVEIWEGDALAGGLYGVALGGAFFGESMFSARPDGSKLALAALVGLLRAAEFTLLDTQFLTDHLASLGAIEIPRAEYHARLQGALQRRASLPVGRAELMLDQLVQRSTQTSKRG